MFSIHASYERHERDESRGHLVLKGMASVVLAGLILAALVAPCLAQDAGPLADLQTEPPTLDVNATDFPDASLVDCGSLRDDTTGQRGFLFAGGEGHFYFEDGSRGRFWGINVAKDSVFQPQERIDKAIACISRAGFNLVRLHHVDDVGGLLPAERAAGDGPRIDPERLKVLDYWIAQLGKRGIYVYLDLLDYRTFYPSEGVAAGTALGRGAKPAALFNERLIQLQLDYARQLLIEHVNAYTGRSYAQDPTVCMIELFDENGLFITRKHWPELVSPYKEELTRRWNWWLKGRYTTTAALKDAWTDLHGQCGLREGENLEQGTVGLPGVSAPPPTEEGFPSPTLTPTQNLGLGRRNDLLLFMNTLHRDYFKQMRDYLRARGVRAPITAVGDFRNIADLSAVASELDFVGMNYYYDHPYFKPGHEWQLPAYIGNLSPIADDSTDTFVPQLCVAKTVGKPVVVREWGACWPNKQRSAGVLEVAAYASLQDADALILFTFATQPGKRKLDYFAVEHDPTRWGLASLAARMFLKRQIAPARHRAAIAYSTTDTFFDGGPALSQVYGLGYVTGLANLFFDKSCETKLNLTIASGRSSDAAYPGKRVIICGNHPAEDLLDHTREKSPAEKSGYEVSTTPSNTLSFTFGGTMYASGQKVSLHTFPGFALADVESNRDLRPIGKGEDGVTTYGFRDMARQSYVFRAISEENKLRVACDALGQIFDEPINHEAAAERRFVSDTRQIVRVEGQNLLIVDTPTAQGLSGALSEGTLKTSQLSLQTTSAVGTLMWVSLDGKPADASQRWQLKMVTIAANTGEKKEPHPAGQGVVKTALIAAGDGPVLTFGEASPKPTIITLAGTEIARIGLYNGSFEIVRDRRDYIVYCDTPGVKIELPALGKDVYATSADGKREEMSQPVTYPKGARFIVVRGRTGPEA